YQKARVVYRTATHAIDSYYGQSWQRHVLRQRHNDFLRWRNLNNTFRNETETRRQRKSSPREWPCTK
ncbi:hypothetical protein LTS18_012681, partial [Coniosporium uncinatum]